MKRILLATTAMLSAAALAAPCAFANSNAGSTVWICTTQQPDDLLLAAFELLTYVEIGAVGDHGETGSSTNILNYDTWDTDVIQKAKGLTNAGDPTIEVARIVGDAGQVALRAAAKTKFNYAFKIVRNDAPDAGTPSIMYNRGLVTGPTRPNGRNESFDLEVFTLALNQREIVDDAA